MKIKASLILSLSALVLLTACAAKPATSEPSQETSQVSTSSSSEERINPEQAYAPILAKYARLSTDGQAALPAISQGLDAEEVSLFNQVAEAASSGKSKHYTFYDINQDQIEELIIGDKQGINAIYTLKGEEVVFLKAAGVASTGGARSALTIYQDGSIQYVAGSSRNPNWEAVAYKIKDASLLEVEKANFTISTGMDLASLVGIEADQVDLGA